MMKKISVPMPLIRMAMLGSKPIRMGASTVAPNIAITCCTPMVAVCGQRALIGAYDPALLQDRAAFFGPVQHAHRSLLVAKE